MTLTQPVEISSSLKPCVRVGGAEVCIEYAQRPSSESRTRYRWQVNLPGGTEVVGDDLQSGCQGGDLQEGLRALLNFLTAFGGARHEHSDCWDLFPESLREWAQANYEELGMLAIELKETPDAIRECCN